MKIKQFLLVILIAMYSQATFAQLKVLSNGNMGVGTNTPIGKLHVNGRIFLTGNGYTFRILPDNPGCEIGTSSGEIIFWYSEPVGLLKLYAKNYYKGFPDKSKQSILPINNSLDAIMNLEGISYKSDSTNNIDFGFKEEDIEKVFPEMISLTNKGINAIDYDMFIPVLVEAIKEQQKQIEILQQIVYSQENEIINLKSTDNTQQDFTLNTDKVDEEMPILYDNIPNPFNTETLIKYYIPENTNSANIYIYDLQGKEMKSFEIKETGDGNITINASELYAGMFVYTLIIDNKIIDTKRMILTNN